MRIGFPRTGTAVRRLERELARLDHEAPAKPGAMDMDTTELAYRRGADIEVALLWNRASGDLTVAVTDTASGDWFDVHVPPDEGLIAFYHPYAYAPVRELAR